MDGHSRVLVTGASGFIGQAVVRRLAQSAMTVRSASRHRPPMAPSIETVAAPDISLGTRADWRAAVSDVRVVVHTAARVHVMRETAADARGEYQRANTEATIALASQAARAGVERFIFLSSIKVNGEETRPGAPFRPSDIPAPLDAYGFSKLAAEEGLRALGRATGMEIVIVRPVLVYGPGVKANFHTLMRWMRTGIPLPFGAIHNRRSLVAIDNLVDLVHLCTTHPGAANQTLLVSDGEDVSTSELLRRIAAAMGRRARLVRVPESMLRGAADLAGRADLARRLFASLQVDITATREAIGWTPSVSLDEGLRRAAAAFR